MVKAHVRKDFESPIKSLLFFATQFQVGMCAAMKADASNIRKLG